MAVDAIFDSVSVGTTMREQLAEHGIIFCSFGEAVQDHPDLVEKYLGSVVPYSDNFFAALNSAVFSDGSFVYVPKGVRCPIELSTYFRINAADTGQFERTLIVADEGAYVSYLEGCTAPKRSHEPAARGGGGARRAQGRDDQVLDGAELVRRRQGRRRRHLQLRHQARQGVRERQDLVDAGGDRLGDHVEVSERDPAGRQLGRRVLLGGGGEQPPAGRHGHEDDPHRQEHEVQHRVQGHLRRARATTRIAAACTWLPKATGARNYTQCDSMLVGNQCGAHTFPYIEVAEQHRAASSTRRARRRSARIRSSISSSAGYRPSRPCR